ncbi:MAG: hypothetical protein ABI899_08605 [Actinomycetota bacterium]
MPDHLGRLLPAADSAACWAALDALAHQMAGVDPTTGSNTKAAGR